MQVDIDEVNKIAHGLKARLDNLARMNEAALRRPVCLLVFVPAPDGCVHNCLEPLTHVEVLHGITVCIVLGTSLMCVKDTHCTLFMTGKSRHMVLLQVRYTTVTVQIHVQPEIFQHQGLLDGFLQ